jgi:1,4-dihydroxy-2-naphthoate octaprenyltransferase
VQILWATGVGAFILCTLVSGSLTRKALLALTDTEKARLVDVTARTSFGWFFFFIALFIAWFVVAQLWSAYWFVAVVALFVAVMTLSVVASVRTHARYRAAGLPSSFLTTFVRARALRVMGAALFFSVIVYAAFTDARGG